MPKFDPLAPVRGWDIDIELAGRTWTIPASSAADWFIPIVSGQPEAMLDLLPEGPAEIEDALFDGHIEWAALEEAYHDAVEQVSGLHWWEAQRLMAIAADWDGAGSELLLRGVRMEEMTVAQVCAACWRVISRNAEEKDLNKIRNEIEKPPPGVDYEAAIDDEENMKAFAAIPSG